MTPALDVLIVAGSLAAAYAALRLIQAVRFYLKYRGEKVVSCPENHRPAAVRVAAGHLAMEAMAGEPQLQISACSRWPGKKNCPQECLAQIEEAPHACLVWTIMNQWYEGQECVYCHKPFTQIHWHDHPPALLNKEGKTSQWNEIPAQNLQGALATHRPVCWSCHIAEKFRREHPELVVDRPSSALRMNLYH